ncbi:DUF1674-domain-containing protein [Nemania diffusa]|nr:DUF1674-domain-containing protein [Nemania diffusa]
MSTRLTRIMRPLRPLRPSLTTPRAPRTRPSSTFNPGPSPPRLPASDQAEFERLQRTANTQAGFTATSSPDPHPAAATAAATGGEGAAAAAAAGEGEKAPAPLRRGSPPEFEGDVNPRTGEVGGPKNEPLRWGAGGDYSYNGRVTDF